MALTIEATYENGVFKPVQSLAQFEEGKRVWVTLHVAAEQDRVRATYGLLGYTGDAETVHRVLFDPEFGVLDVP